MTKFVVLPTSWVPITLHNIQIINIFTGNNILVTIMNGNILVTITHGNTIPASCLKAQ